MIFKYAFQPQAIIGGGFGYALKTALSQGAKRGLFSNEAGMGSTPHAHAQAHVKSPHDQGVVAMIGVFMDTFVVLTLNALVIISTLYTPDGPLANGYTGSVTGILGKSNLAQTAFGTVFGSRFGAIFVAVCLFFFAFSTVLSWNLFGKINVIYLFGRENAKRSTAVYTVIALVFIFAGTMMSNDLVWELTDLFNNLMVLPNALALFAPSPAPLPPSQGTKQKHSCKKKPPPFRIGNGGGLLFFQPMESSWYTQSRTSVVVYSSAPVRQTTCAMPALMMSRRHMAQGSFPDNSRRWRCRARQDRASRPSCRAARRK